MSAYHRDRLKEEKTSSLERRRERLKDLLQDETDQLEEELRKMVPDTSALARLLVEKTEHLRTAREERRKRVMKPMTNQCDSFIFCLLVHLIHLVDAFNQSNSANKVEQKIKDQKGTVPTVFRLSGQGTACIYQAQCQMTTLSLTQRHDACIGLSDLSVVLDLYTARTRAA